jgi:hypothetical protein
VGLEHTSREAKNLLAALVRKSVFRSEKITMNDLE